MSGEALTCPELVRRRAMKVAVSAVCSDVGFSLAEESSLETLVEMVISFMTELGRSARAFSELSCRTESMPSDVAMALIEMGQKIEELPVYAKSTKQTVFLPPGHAPPQPTPRILQVGERRSHPAHIPDYLPAFPDPHTHITTLTHKAPITEYQLIREKAASQKRDVERALTRFIAKTGDTESLFQDDPYAFPLIANRPKTLPYLEALLPKDEDLSAQEEEARSSSQMPSQAPPPAQVTTPPPAKPEPDKTTPTPTTPASGAPGGEPKQDAANTSATEGGEMGEGQIDNPYLRAITMPKLKGGGKKHKW